MAWRERQATRFPCPCCGFLVFDAPPGTYEMCPLCNWENCAIQLRFPRSPVGPNEPLVDEQRRAMERIAPDTRSLEGYARDPGWRPLKPGDFDENEAGPRDGLEYFNAVAEDEPVQEPYYWRQPTASVGPE